MKVAYYSPLPPERSGIADYSALLLPALGRRVEIEVAARRRRAPPADVALYHVGNNPEAHGWIVEALRERPGVVVLHEFVLHHLVAGMTLGRGDPDLYLRALEREGGLPARLLGYGVLDGSLPSLWEWRPEEFALAGEVLDHATALVVHSRYVEERARAAGYERRIARIPLAAAPPPRLEPVDLGVGPVVGCFGHLNAAKRIPQLVEAFVRLRRRHPSARLVLVGQIASGFDLAGHLARFGLERSDAVLRDDYVPAERLWALMASADVCVNLRAPTMGETSASALQSMSLDRPLVVSDVGWFSELPDDVVLKVPVDEHEVGTLAAALDLVVSREDVRSALGEAALAYVRRVHDVEHVAEAYVELLELAAGGEAVTNAVLGELAQAAATVGLDVSSPELDALARRVRELRIAP